MSEDRPVTSKDFEKLIKAVQTTNKKLDAQAENSMMGIGGKVKERFKGIGDAIKAPLDNLEGAIKAPFEAVGGAVESIGEAVMKPFESFKNVTQGFKNLMGDSEQEQQNSLLGDILEQSKKQTKIFEDQLEAIKKGAKPREGIFDEVVGNISTLATIRASQFASGKLADKKGALGFAGKAASALGGVGQVVGTAKPTRDDIAGPRLKQISADKEQFELFEQLGGGVLEVAEEAKLITSGIENVGKYLQESNQILEAQFDLDLQSAKDEKGNDLREAELRREKLALPEPSEIGPGGLPSPKPKKDGGFLGGIMGFLKDGLIAIAGGVTAFGAFIKPLLTRLAAFGKVISKVFMGLSKAFLPLTVALGVVGAIFGGIKGFKEDGFVGLVNGIISGVFDAIVGGVVAALGSLGTTLLKAFGLDKTARAFQQTLNSLFETVRATIMAPVLLLKGLFTGDFELIKETIGNLINMLREGILNSFKFVLAAVMEIPVLLLGAIKALGVGLLKVIGGIGIALFNALKVIFLDLPLFIGDAIISGLSSLFSLFGKLPGAIAAGIGALLPGGKSPGEAFMAALTSGGEGEEEKPEKKSQRRTKRTKTAVEKVVATQEERDFTMAAESFDRSEANLKAFESEAGGDFTIKEKLQEGGDPADPTDYVKEKVYNDPKKQKQFERLKEVRDKALRKKSELGGGLVKAFKEKFGKGLRGRTIADSELSQMGGQEGFLEKIQNRTGAKMQQEQDESMERSAAAQAFRDRQGERTDRGRVINAPTKNNVVNTTINEAPKHVDRTTQLFGALPPGMAY